MYRHYQAGHLIQPLTDWPHWLAEGVNYLGFIEGKEREREMDEARHKRGGK